LSAVPCFTSRGRVGPPCSSQPSRDPIVSRVLAWPCCSQSKWNPIVSRRRVWSVLTPCCSQPKWDPIAGRGWVGPPCSSQPSWDPIACRGRVGHSQPNYFYRAVQAAVASDATENGGRRPAGLPEFCSERQAKLGRKRPALAAVQGKAAPLPRIDFSYKAATVPVSPSRTVVLMSSRGQKHTRGHQRPFVH
jgi:hypothetical protein